MTRNLKTLGRALAAVLAISAIGAAGASAEYEFESEAEKTVIAGEQSVQHKAEIQGQTLTCEKVEFAGTTKAKKVEKVTITPTYKNCSYNGKFAEIRTNGCDYTLDKKTVSGFGRVHLECPGSEVMEVVITLFSKPCVATVPAQTATQGVKYTNATPVGEKKYVVAHANLGFETSEAHGEELCGFFLSFASVTYTGTSILVGVDEANTQITGITVAGAPDH